MEKHVVCVATLMSAAAAELLSTAAVGQQFANLGLRQQIFSAVLATADPNLLICGSIAIA